MGYKNIFATAFILGLIIIGMFVFAYLERRNISKDILQNKTETIEYLTYDKDINTSAKYFNKKLGTDALQSLI